MNENENINQIENVNTNEIPLPVQNISNAAANVANTDLKQKALAMLKNKTKRPEENVNDEERDTKKRAIEEENVDKIVQFELILPSEDKNIIQNENENENQKEDIKMSEVKNINQNVNINTENNNTENIISEENINNENIKHNEQVLPVDNIQESKEAPVELPIPPQINESSNPIEQPEEKENVPVINTSNIQLNPIQPVQEAPHKTAKKISFSEAKKEIDEFANQISKMEEEIKNKYDVNLNEFYLEDLLPDELKMKLIEDFFNSDEIIELSKKVSN